MEHKPVAKEKVEVMLFEPATTLNTGNIENELIKKELHSISFDAIKKHLI